MARTFSQSKYCKEIIKDTGKGKGQEPLLEIAGTSVENVKEFNFLGTANLKLDSHFHNWLIRDKTGSKINGHSFPSLSSIYKVWFY